MAHEESCGEARYGFVDEAGRFFDTLDDLYISHQRTMLVRHAETAANTGESTGLDDPLTARGVRQGQGLASYLSDQNLDGFVGRVSPFLRTLMTARLIAARTGVRFVVDPMLSEYGVRGGCSVRVPVRADEFPEFDWREYSTAYEFGCESRDEFRRRVERLASPNRPVDLLCVTHGAIVWTAVAVISGQYEDYSRVSNASVSLIEGHHPVYLFRNEWGV
jgi:broad specificity phosphatase PhoE